MNKVYIGLVMFLLVVGVFTLSVNFGSADDNPSEIIDPYAGVHEDFCVGKLIPPASKCTRHGKHECVQTNKGACTWACTTNPVTGALEWTLPNKCSSGTCNINSDGCGKRTPGSSPESPDCNSAILDCS